MNWQICLSTATRQSMFIVTVTGNTTHDVSAQIQTVVNGNFGSEYTCPFQPFAPGTTRVCYGGMWPSGHSSSVQGYGRAEYDGKVGAPILSGAASVQ